LDRGCLSWLPIGTIDFSIVLKSQVLGWCLHCVIEAIHEGKIASLQHDVGSTLAAKGTNDLSVIRIANRLWMAR
jgi:hypothetical protein